MTGFSDTVVQLIDTGKLEAECGVKERISEEQ